MGNYVAFDRVKETSITTGTGTITLAGAVTGYRSFSVVGNGSTVFYCIEMQDLSAWEVGSGTYTSSGTTLSRSTVLASSNSGSLVNFAAGTKNVFLVAPATVFQGFGPAGAGHYAGCVPDPGSTSHTPAYWLAEDCTWKSQADMLTAATGDSITLQGNSSYVQAQAGGALVLQGGLSSIFADDGSGNVTINSYAGANFTLTGSAKIDD